MAKTYQEELLENYDELRKSRDWSWETMARTVEHDPALAAELRERFVSKAKDAKPVDRKAAPKSEA